MAKFEYGLVSVTGSVAYDADLRDSEGANSRFYRCHLSGGRYRKCIFIDCTVDSANRPEFDNCRFYPTLETVQ